MRVNLRGRSGTPVAVGTMEGSRFYRDPVCTHILETPRLLVGVSEQALPRKSPDAPTTQCHSFRFLPMQTDKPNRIVGRLREPPVYPEPLLVAR